MRHGNKQRKFGRTNKKRDALMHSLVLALTTHGKIKTTQAKAKSLRVEIEKLVTTSKVDSLANRRLLISRVGAGSARKLLADIGPRFKERKGGYTRIRNMAPRLSDGAAMAVIEFVE